MDRRHRRREERKDAKFARQHINRWFQDESERAAVMRSVAQSIELAHAAGPNRQGLTLLVPGKRIRLNVGMVNVLVVDADGPCWLLLVSKAPVEPRPKWLVKPTNYKNAPECLGVSVPATGLDDSYRELKQSHADAVVKAAKGKRRYGAGGSHAWGLVEYIARELGSPFHRDRTTRSSMRRRKLLLPPPPTERHAGG